MTAKRKRRDQEEDAATPLAIPKQPRQRAQTERGGISAEELAFRSLLASCSPSPVPPAYHSVFSSIINGKDDAASASALRLKRDARLPHNVHTSDLPLRLFYQQRRCIDKAAVAEPAESTAELAIRIADALQRTLSTPVATAETPSTVVITSVSTASMDQTALGIPTDRLVVQLREIARVNPTELQPTESSTSPSHHTTEQSVHWLYRDDAIGVIDKPTGVLSVDGNDPRLGPSIHRQVRALYPDARMVHRLDLETSGLLVVAFTKSAAQYLNKQFRDRTVRKTYIARVAGRVTWAETQRRLRLPVERDPDHKLLQRVVTDRDVPSDSALWSVTDVKVVDPGDDSTLVELKPETGKTHQLRVHMLHVGHPILGDSLYAPDRVQLLAPRLCLHAAWLRFTHPDTGESLEFESACPF